MRATTLVIAAGVSAPLILSGSASGGFVGITTTSKPNVFGILTVNVYAEFDRPSEDHMLAVTGTPNAPLRIEVIGGTFYQHAFGSDRPPADAFNKFPSLHFDTFVTIGVKHFPNFQPDDQMVLTTNWPGFGASTLETSDAGWAITALDPQGDPFNPLYFPGDGRVLIGQFSTVDGVGIEGTMLLQYISNGVTVQSVESFFHVPGPAALALFGLAGLMGTRRRCRQSRARHGNMVARPDRGLQISWRRHTMEI